MKLTNDVVIEDILKKVSPRLSLCGCGCGWIFDGLRDSRLGDSCCRSVCWIHVREGVLELGREYWSKKINLASPNSLEEAVESLRGLL